jgi:hypothetical protein
MGCGGIDSFVCSIRKKKETKYTKICLTNEASMRSMLMLLDYRTVQVQHQILK